MKIDSVLNLRFGKNNIKNQNISYLSNKMPYDCFQKSSDILEIDENKFQKKLGVFGMSQKELSRFLKEYSYANFAVFEKGMNELADGDLELEKELFKNIYFILLMPSGVNKNIDSDFDFKEGCKEYFFKYSPVCNIENFYNWFSKGKYEQYRNEQLAQIRNLAKGSEIRDIQEVDRLIHDFKEITELYSNSGSVQEIMEWFSSPEYYQNCIDILFKLPVEYSKPVFDILYPDYKNLAGNKLAMCLFLNKSNMYAKIQEGFKSFVKTGSQLLFLDSFDESSIGELEKGKDVTIQILIKQTSTPNEEIEDFYDKHEPLLLNKILQLKLALLNMDEFYNSQMRLDNLCEIYQDGLLKNDKNKVSAVLKSIIPSLNTTQIDNISEYLITNQDLIFEENTIGRKDIGGIITSNAEFDNSKKSVKITKADIYDLILTGFFINNILNLFKSQPDILQSSPNVLKFFEDGVEYASLTKFQTHKICEELAFEYKNNPLFAEKTDKLFKSTELSNDAISILSNVQVLSDKIDEFSRKIRDSKKTESDKYFIDEICKIYDIDTQDDISDKFLADFQNEIKQNVQKSASQRKVLKFSKHAILRLIGRDLVNPKNKNGKYIDFTSLLTLIYFNALKSGGNDFTIQGINGFSGIKIKAAFNNDEILIKTIY